MVSAAVHHVVGLAISRQRNSGYRPSTVNIWHKVSPLPSPVPSLSPYTYLSKKEVAQQLHYTHHHWLA